MAKKKINVSKASNAEKNMRRCASFNCSSVQVNKDKNYLKFHSFPRDKTLSNIWIVNSGRLDLKLRNCLPKGLFCSSYKLCSLHFNDDQYVNNLRNKLKSNALPTVFPSSCQGKDEVEMENKVLMEEKLKSEVFVVQGIKTEDKEIKTEKLTYEIDTEEMNLERDGFCYKEKVYNDLDYLRLLNGENFQISEVAVVQRTRIPNNDSISATIIEIEDKGSLKDGNYSHMAEECLDKKSDAQFFGCEKVDVTKHSEKEIHIKLKTYHCRNCECIFNSKYQRDKHAISIHGKEKPYKCRECDYSCCELDSLTNHLRSKHKNLKPFKCIECDYSSDQNDELKKHINSLHRYLTEESYKCLECENSFCSNSSLRTHIISVHRKF